MSFAQWRVDKAGFNQKAGPVTWYKNPANVPEGIYGAVDFDSRLKNLAVHCGYLMWMQWPDRSYVLISEPDRTRTGPPSRR